MPSVVDWWIDGMWMYVDLNVKCYEACSTLRKKVKNTWDEKDDNCDKN
jgi:hypothetical protein